MRNFQRIFSGACWILLATALTPLAAEEEFIEFSDSAQLKAQVEFYSDGLLVEATRAEVAGRLVLRIYDEADREIFTETGAAIKNIAFLVDNLPDGNYRYEALLMYGATEHSEVGSFAKISREYGDFSISNGMLKRNTTQSSVSIGSLFELLAGTIATSISTAAHAADLIVSSQFPSVLFRDTSETPDRTGFVILTQADDNFEYFRIYDTTSADEPTFFDYTSAPGGSNGANSISIKSTGNIGFAANRFWMDRNNSHFGIGTSGPSEELQINATAPTIFLVEEDLISGARLRLNNRHLGILGQSAQTVAAIDVRAPQASFDIDTNGDIGIGTPSPQALLHLEKSNPDIRFENPSTGNNSMSLEFSNNFLRIKGASDQDLGKIHTQAPVGTFTTDAKGRTGYGTANPAASFNVKYRGAHGSVPIFLAQAANNDEVFRVQLNGDTFLRGALIHSSDRNAKTAIQPVDTKAILEKVTQLPINQWQYKASQGTNHLGPMAQDFKAAFNLGATDTGIATVDLDGVALASIQALADESVVKQNEIDQLKAGHRELLVALIAERQENTAQRTELEALRSDRERLQRLEAIVAELAADKAEPVLTSTR